MGCQRAVHPGREVPVPAWRISQYEAYEYCNKIWNQEFTAEDAKGAEEQNLTAECHGFTRIIPLANLRSAAAPPRLFGKRLLRGENQQFTAENAEEGKAKKR